MGTNYYFITKEKAVAERFAPGKYELTDTPFFGYSIHIAKISCGWLPLFQGYVGGIQSVEDIRAAYLTRKFQIFDEYDREHSWEDFSSEVLNHNGGIAGFSEKIPYIRSYYNDPDMPDFLPVSHFEYGKGKYASRYFRDKQGYEFTYEDFM